MKTYILPILTGVLIVSTSAIAQNPTVELRSLQVVSEAAQGDDNLKPHGFSGTTASVLVGLPTGGITDLDEKASKVTSFKDEKGKDLMQKAAAAGAFHFGGSGGIGMFSKISKDGKAVLFDVSAPNIPTKGAKTLTLTGEVVLKVATQKKEIKVPNIALKPGTIIKADAITFTVKKTGKPDFTFGDDAPSFAVTLEAKQDLSNVADIKFLDATGKDLGAKRGQSSSMSFGSNVTIEQEYTLKTQAATATVVITLWIDQKTIKAPLNLTFGVGL